MGWASGVVVTSIWPPSHISAWSGITSPTMRRCSARTVCLSSSSKPPLLHQRRQRLLLEKRGVGPGQVEQDLEIGDVLVVPGLGRRRPYRRQLAVAGEAVNDPQVDVEEPLDDEPALTPAEVLGRDHGVLPVAIDGALGEVLSWSRRVGSG